MWFLNDGCNADKNDRNLCGFRFWNHWRMEENIMSNIHKNPTISFRVSEWERREIETRIRASGLLKKDYFVRSCIYNRICVVGKKETIVLMLEEMQNMQIICVVSESQKK